MTAETKTYIRQRIIEHTGMYIGEVLPEFFLGNGKASITQAHCPEAKYPHSTNVLVNSSGQAFAWGEFGHN